MCVLRINKGILRYNNVVVADQNASSDYVRFGGCVNGLRLISRELVYARSWIHPEDQKLEWRHGSIMCAEVLVPDRVPPDDLMGVYVSCEETLSRVSADVGKLPIIVDADLFFQMEQGRND